MSHRQYTSVLGAVSPTGRGAARVADIVAALAPPPAGSTALVRADAKPPSLSVSAMGLAPGLAGAGVGALAWKKHRVLGALAGHALASTALPLYHGGAARTDALYQLGIEAAGIGGSLYWKKHPFLGWVAGMVAGTTAATLMPSSPQRSRYNKWRAEMSK